MSLIGIKCDDISAYGDEFTFDECIACALAGGPRKCHTPTALLVAMQRAQHDRKDAGISATMLLDCPRKVALQSTEDWTEHPSDFFARFHGTAWHNAVEAFAVDSDDLIIETRFRKSYDVDGILVEVTGKPDCIIKSRRIILDDKTCKSVGVKPINAGKPKPGHAEQINIYADLLDGGVDMRTGEIVHVPIEFGGINYIAPGSKNGANYKKVAVPIWSADERYAYIVERLRPIAEFKRSGALPPILMDPEKPSFRSWKCAPKWCPLREQCDAALDAEKAQSAQSAQNAPVD